MMKSTDRVRSMTTLLIELEQAVSAERLQPYRQSPGDPPLQIHARYLWNVALSESLYPTLQAVEIALRNSLHDAAAAHFGTDVWFDLTSPIGTPLLLPNDTRRIRDLKAELRQRFGSSGRTITAGDIVAGLNFGFWTSLFNTPYERPHLLWPHLLTAVFPAAPRRDRTRRNLLNRLDEIRRFRNRVFHHEPIWNRSNLVVQHAHLVETIGWISPVLRERTLLLDRFLDVHGAGMTSIEQQLADLSRAPARQTPN